MLDGFHRYREHTAFIVNRHEGGAAFMAEAAGKLTGKPGVCFVTRAPGATNACIGVHTAFQDSTPMVLFVGDVARAFAAALAALQAPASVPWRAWTASCHADYLANLQPNTIAALPADTARGLVDMPQVMQVLQKHLPADAVVTNGAGNFASWVHRFYRFHGLAKGHKNRDDAGARTHQHPCQFEHHYAGGAATVKRSSMSHCYQ